MHLPFVQANSESEHPISGSLISSLYAAAVPKSSPSNVSMPGFVNEILPSFPAVVSFEEATVGIVVENILAKLCWFFAILASVTCCFMSSLKFEFVVNAITTVNKLIPIKYEYTNLMNDFETSVK